MFLASASDLSLAVGVIALLLTLAGIAAVGVVYLSRRQQAASTLQSDTITALEVANNLKGEQIRTLRHDMETDRVKCAADLAQHQTLIDGLTEQVAILKELVTQKAHVQALRDEIDVGFKAVTAEIRKLASAS